MTSPTVLRPSDYARLLAVVEELVDERPDRPEDVGDVIARASRTLTDSDGASFGVRDGDCIRYVAEDSATPLWAGQSYPLRDSISGWAIADERPVVANDLQSDPRAPIEARHPTPARGLAAVPVGREEPVAALSASWEAPHAPTVREVELLERLAFAAGLALRAAFSNDGFDRLERLLRGATRAAELAAR